MLCCCGLCVCVCVCKFLGKKKITHIHTLVQKKKKHPTKMSNFDDTQHYYEAEHKQSLGGITLWIILIALFVMSTVAIALPFVLEPNKGEQGPQGISGTNGTNGTGTNGTNGTNGTDGKSGTMITSLEELGYDGKQKIIYIPRIFEFGSKETYGFKLVGGRFTIWPLEGKTFTASEDIFKTGDFLRLEGGNRKYSSFQILRVTDFTNNDNVPDHTEIELLYEPADDEAFGNHIAGLRFSRIRFTEKDKSE